MPIRANRPRSGRILDLLVIATAGFVFVGLALFHYRRLDRSHVDAERAKELADRKFADVKKTASHDWPHWRGPNHDGVSTETDILTQWPEGGPKQLWEAKTGLGFASVSVSDGRAITIFQDGDKVTVVAWNAETGKELWRFAYEQRYMNSFGDGPRSTPAIDGERVYTVGGTGIMHCLSGDAGKKLWSKDLMSEFGASIPEWGVSFSPLVDDKHVYVMPGGPDGNSLAALDKRTGAIVWKKHSDPASYSSPMSATIGGERQILFLTGTRLVSVTPDTGEEKWSYPWATQQSANIAMPIVLDDYVHLSSYYGRGCAVLKIDKKGDAWEPSLVYQNNRMNTHIGSSVFVKGHIYGFDNEILKCMDFRTGKVVKQWSQRDFHKGSLLAVNDHLIIYGAYGKLALAEANPVEYVEKSSFQFSKQGKSCWSVPTLANGRLYVRDWDRLVCFDMRAKSR